MDKFLSRKQTFDDNKASTSAQTSIVPKIKSRKYSQEYLNFGFTITEVNGEEKPLCVICSKILAADSMKPNKHFENLKRHFETLHARCKKPHTIAEELILPAAIEIVETMFGDNFAKELQSIPLSNDTVSRRIDDISEDVEQQLFGKLRDKLFSIQLDEATDSNKDAHFIAYVRFWDGMSAEEELIFCKPIKLKATAIALLDILNNFINEANIEWKNCVGICTDGARTMSGRFKSIQALVKQKSPLCIWTHCMIHRESLASKEISPGLNIVLMTVVTVITHKIHLGELILQSAQYAYPYIIKLIYMGEKQQKNIIYNFPKRKVDGVKHTSKFEGQRDDNQKYYSRGYKKRNKKSLIAGLQQSKQNIFFIWFWDQR
ncbi:SCAN domain-containing protein 3 [Trichonephila clavipes]|nr:SCAN domain-containing protein 3 [Trichonephila clavipes]